VGAVSRACQNHEDPGPSPSLVSSRPEVGTTSSALPLPQPAARKEKGRAMVFRRNWARGLLLRTGDDHAAGARRPVESGNFLPWRSNYGTAEGLEKLFSQTCLTCSCHLTKIIGNSSIAPLWSPRFPVGNRKFQISQEQDKI